MSDFLIITHLILTIALEDRNYHYVYVICKKTEAWREEGKHNGRIPGKWQNQDSRPDLANFYSHAYNSYAILALLVSQKTILGGRKSLLIHIISVLNPSSLLCSHPQYFQYFLRGSKLKE